jgi:hypothetical protein
MYSNQQLSRNSFDVMLSDSEGGAKHPMTLPRFMLWRVFYRNPQLLFCPKPCRDASLRHPIKRNISVLWGPRLRSA